MNVIPHLTCVNASQDDIATIIENYWDLGVTKILALRGDLLLDQKRESDFTYAIDLIKYIKKIKPQITLGTACFPEGHPETPDRLNELAFL